jgi:hypothetical protein
MTTETLDDVIRQLDLFSVAAKQTALPHNGTPTSALAALKGRDKARGDRLRILAFLVERGERGATCWEVEEGLNIMHQTASARISGMADDHWIEPLNEVRRTGTGSSARVWVISAHGREALSAGQNNDPACQNVADVTATRSGV